MLGKRRIKRMGFLLFLIVAAAASLAARGREGDLGRFREKISPILSEEVALLNARPEYDYPIPVIIKVREDFFQEIRSRAGGPNALPLIHGFHSRLNSRAIRQLLDSDLVEYVTLDAPLQTDGKPAGTPGAPTRTEATTVRTIGANLAHDMSFKGGEATIALFDSGIFNHQDLDKGRRVKEAVDFTTGVARVLNSRDDLYGHGSHVAGIVGGSGKKSGGFYTGVAPKVRFVDLRVVGADGTGQTSNLIKAIDWLIQNRRRYNVRVANLSLGHAPLESYRNDPLGQAVGRLVEAGVTTVVSAGNLGRAAGYPKIWGAISSPGNHPAVITVSAVNTFDTVTQDDDEATSYSSRGPTYVDNIFKPDLTAPGNSICSLNADGWLSREYPELVLDRNYIHLSGSSMATAHVSGTVALMLSANENLTPRMIKMILLLTASKLRKPHMLEQGNGMVNAFTAVNLALGLDTTTKSLTGVVSPFWQSDGETVWAGGALAIGDRIFYSSLVDSSAPAFWGSGTAWESHLAPDAFVWSDSFFSADSSIWDQVLHGEDSFWLEGTFWTDVAWSDDFLNSSSVFWTDTGLTRGTVFWSDGFIWADSINAHNYGGDR